MPKNTEIQYEAERDFATRFVAEQYITNGYGSHFHRNLEIYGVVDGEVLVSIAGDKRVLTNGQIAVVNCMEVHEYSVSKEAEIFYFHIGTAYLSTFISLNKHSLLPHWLLDTEYNKKLYEEISKLFNIQDTLSELKKFGIATILFADIVDRYGVISGGYNNKSHEFIEKDIQYIYEHYTEDITLKKLADVFCIESKFLSYNLSGYIGTDLRAFINDIRYGKALQMMNSPEMRGKTKKEIMALCGFKNERTFYYVNKRNSKFYNSDDKL